MSGEFLGTVLGIWIVDVGQFSYTSLSFSRGCFVMTLFISMISEDDCSMTRALAINVPDSIETVYIIFVTVGQKFAQSSLTGSGIRLASTRKSPSLYNFLRTLHAYYIGLSSVDTPLTDHHSQMRRCSKLRLA